MAANGLASALDAAEGKPPNNAAKGSEEWAVEGCGEAKGAGAGAGAGAEAKAGAGAGAACPAGADTVTMWMISPSAML